MMKTLLIAAVMTLTLPSISCITANRHYRINEPVITAGCDQQKGYRIKYELKQKPVKPELAFIEFDDMGELWDRENCKSLGDGAKCQLKTALDLIESKKAHDKKVVVVTYIHGWNNNAKSSDVDRFQCFLTELQSNAKGDFVYLGVYLAWRGRLSGTPLLKRLTFWNRRQAAMRVATVSITETILRLMQKTKTAGGQPSDDNKFIVMGHSFGGLILERAIAQAITGWLTTDANTSPCTPGDPTRKCFKSPADLVVLLNPAIESIESNQLVDMLRRQDIKVVSQTPADLTAEGGQPLLVSITGSTDNATKLVLPFGHFLVSLNKNFRKKEKTIEDCDGGDKVSSQRRLYTHTAGHLPYFVSHKISNKKEPQCNEDCSTNPFNPSRKECPVLCFVEPVSGDTHYVYRNGPNFNPCNKTPYWILNVDRPFIDGHGGVWGDELRALLLKLATVTAERKTTTLAYPVR